VTLRDTILQAFQSALEKACTSGWSVSLDNGVSLTKFLGLGFPAGEMATTRNRFLTGGGGATVWCEDVSFNVNFAYKLPNTIDMSDGVKALIYIQSVDLLKDREDLQYSFYVGTVQDSNYGFFFKTKSQLKAGWQEVSWTADDPQKIEGGTVDWTQVEYAFCEFRLDNEQTPFTYDLLVVDSISSYDYRPLLEKVYPYHSIPATVPYQTYGAFGVLTETWNSLYPPLTTNRLTLSVDLCKRNAASAETLDSLAQLVSGAHQALLSDPILNGLVDSVQFRETSFSVKPGATWGIATVLVDITYSTLFSQPSLR
jgi:hypothetical protein